MTKKTSENIILKDGERIDDLELSGLKIIQSENAFCFGMDAVLLSGFVCDGLNGANKRAALAKELQSDKDADELHEKNLIDLGTGTGILPLLLYAKMNGQDEKVKYNITGIEIQEESFDMARRSIQMNGLEDEIKIICDNIKNAPDTFGRASFNVVTCNPPYIKAGSGIINPDSKKAVARHEILCTFEDVAKSAKALLERSGKFFLVHRAHRLAEVIDVLRENHLEPKRMRMVHSFETSPAELVLIESIADAGCELIVEKPLFIYKDKDEYTDEIHEIYGF